jgi:hypothetical protein
MLSYNRYEATRRHMSAPIVFISHLKVKDLAAYERMAHEVARRLQAEKPQTAAFLHYLDREESRLTIVHLFADAEAMDRHLEGAETRAQQAWQVMAPEAWEIYGPASDQVQATLRRQAESAGVPLTAHAEYIAGFVRLA